MLIFYLKTDCTQGRNKYIKQFGSIKWDVFSIFSNIDTNSKFVYGIFPNLIATSNSSAIIMWISNTETSSQWCKKYGTWN